MNTLSDAALQELLKSKSVAIFSDLILNPIFSAIELEILARLTEAGTPTTTIVCSGALPWCFQNPGHSALKCLACKSVRNLGQDLATRSLGQQLEINCAADHQKELTQTASEIIDQCKDSSELTELSYKGISVGPGIGATLSFSTKNSKPNLRKHQELVTKLLTSSMIVIEKLPALLELAKAEHLLVGSGRLATNWTASRVAEEMGIAVFAYENIPPNSFSVASLSPFLHIENMKGMITNFEKEIEINMSLISKSKDFFLSQRYPQKINEHNEALANQNIFIQRQITKNLPAEFDPSKRNIAIFTSTEWEFAFLPDWENFLGEDQGEIVSRILLNPDLSSDFVFWVRFHPNQKNSEDDVILEFKKKCGGLCNYIEPNEPVDSYALMEACEKIITFGSTIGMEATYWGIPSILCGRSEYESTDAVYRATSISDAVELINKKIEPKMQSSSFSYGLYRQKRGSEFSHVKLDFPKFPKVHGTISSSQPVKVFFFLLKAIQYLKRRSRW